MSAHIVLLRFDAHNPATLSQKVLTGLLRDQLGFNGVVFTEALNMRAIADRHTPTEAVLGALAAGADMPVHVGPLAEHRDVVAGLRRALDEGRLEPNAVATSLERVANLARRYPARPNPEAAWRKGDEALLQFAAPRGLVQFGELKITPPLTLVTATQVRASAASQTTVSPVEKLRDVLETAGFSVQPLLYTRETLAEARALLPRVAWVPGTVVFISTARTRVKRSGRSRRLWPAPRRRSFTWRCGIRTMSPTCLLRRS